MSQVVMFRSLGYKRCLSQVQMFNRGGYKRSLSWMISKTWTWRVKLSPSPPISSKVYFRNGYFKQTIYFRVLFCCWIGSRLATLGLECIVKKALTVHRGFRSQQNKWFLKMSIIYVHRLCFVIVVCLCRSKTSVTESILEEVSKHLYCLDQNV